MGNYVDTTDIPQSEGTGPEHEEKSENEKSENEGKLENEGKSENETSENEGKLENEGKSENEKSENEGKLENEGKSENEKSENERKLENVGKSENEKSENEGKLENEGISENEKAKELLSKAFVCCHYGDYEEALGLIDTAKHVIVQIQVVHLKLNSSVSVQFAKHALEAKDIKKAEKYAMEADEMYPSEETKTLLAKVLQMKASVKEAKVKSDDNTNVHDEAKCLEIAHAKENITEKRQPEHDFAFFKEITMAESGVIDKHDTKEISPKSVQINIKEPKTDTKLSEVKSEEKEKTAKYRLKCAKEAFEAKDVEKAERLASMADHLYPSEETKTFLAKIVQIKTYNKKVREIAKEALEFEDIEKAERLATKANRMYPSEEAETLLAKIHQIKTFNKKAQAENCLEIAKQALEFEDIEKAERLATKADRMYPSEEAETLLAEIHQIKTYNKNAQAVNCLEIVKQALEFEDIEKAERLATKANRMYPSEEAETLLARVQQIKMSSEIKRENTHYSAGHEENKEQARKCLDIAMDAHAINNIEKCKRFLRKAKLFDKSIDIDVYLSDLQRKKAQEEHEKQVAERMKREKKEQQIKALEESKKAAERLNKAAERAKNESNETQPNYAFARLVEGQFEKGPENEGKSDNVLKAKAKELENKALTCFEVGDFDQALLLLETAKGIHPTKQLHDMVEQVQECIKHKKTSVIKNDKAQENESEKHKSQTIFDGAINLRHMGVKAFHDKKYELAEKWLIESENLYPNHETRNLIIDVRKEINRRRRRPIGLKLFTS